MVHEELSRIRVQFSSVLLDADFSCTVGSKINNFCLFTLIPFGRFEYHLCTSGSHLYTSKTKSVLEVKKQ